MIFIVLLFSFVVSWAAARKKVNKSRKTRRRFVIVKVGKFRAFSVDDRKPEEKFEEIQILRPFIIVRPKWRLRVDDLIDSL